MKKYIFVFLLCIGIIGFNSCGKTATPNDTKSTEPIPTTVSQTGEANFKKHCSACHGMDGNMGIGGAKKLPESVLPVEEREQIITIGKKTMPAFRDKLSTQEIKDLAAYTLTLK